MPLTKTQSLKNFEPFFFVLIQEHDRTETKIGVSEAEIQETEKVVFDLSTIPCKLLLAVEPV